MSLKFSELHVGDRIFEEYFRTSYEVEVLTEPDFDPTDGGKWCFKGMTVSGEIDFMMTEGLEHYGPRLERSAMYARVEYLDGTKYDYFDKFKKH